MLISRDLWVSVCFRKLCSVTEDTTSCQFQPLLYGIKVRHATLENRCFYASLWSGFVWSPATELWKPSHW